MDMQDEDYLVALDDAALSRLLEIVSNVKQDPGQAQFNVIDELHADENAHTRILASLLKVDFVRQSFLRMVRRKLSTTDSILSDEAINHTRSDEVKVFSQYVDSQIVHQKTANAESFAIIIENKIKGAVDQERQLERYVDSIKDTYQIAKSRIIIVYLTLMGEKDVPQSSLSDKTRNEVHKYLPLSYKSDIIPWLDSELCFSLRQIQVEPYLSSGITQYVHHLRGLINERQDDVDLLEKKIEDEIKKCLGCINPYLALSRVNYELGLLVAGNGLLGCQANNRYTRKFMRLLLRREFYWHFDMIVSDDDNGSYIELEDYTLAMYDAYEGQPGDLLYIDFFYEHGVVANYNANLCSFRQGLNRRSNKICYWDALSHNDQNYMRVFISSENDLRILLESLPGTKYVPKQKQGIVTKINKSSALDLESLAKLQIALEEHIERLDETSTRNFSDDKQRNTYYGYRNGWAWQRAPWNGYGEAEVQVFPRKLGDEKELIKYLASNEIVFPTRLFRWNGRVVIAFPLKDINYEADPLLMLGRWRLNNKEILEDITIAGYEIIANTILRKDVACKLNALGVRWTVQDGCYYRKNNEDARTIYIPCMSSKEMPEGVEICCVFDRKGFEGCQIAAWNGKSKKVYVKTYNDESVRNKWHINEDKDWIAWKGIIIDDKNLSAQEYERGMNWDVKFFERIQNDAEYRQLLVDEIVGSILELYNMLTASRGKVKPS